MDSKTPRRSRTALWPWFKRQIIDEVPTPDALCEFDCRKPQCTEEEWAACQRRLEDAAGELWPALGPGVRKNVLDK
jgi:hypothetical protein